VLRQAQHERDLGSARTGLGVLKHVQFVGRWLPCVSASYGSGRCASLRQHSLWFCSFQRIDVTESDDRPNRCRR
jgi:hypothetical protein